MAQPKFSFETSPPQFGYSFDELKIDSYNGFLTGYTPTIEAVTRLGGDYTLTQQLNTVADRSGTFSIIVTNEIDRKATEQQIQELLGPHKFWKFEDGPYEVNHIAFTSIDYSLQEGNFNSIWSIGSILITANCSFKVCQNNSYNP